MPHNNNEADLSPLDNIKSTKQNVYAILSENCVHHHYFFIGYYANRGVPDIREKSKKKLMIN